MQRRLYLHVSPLIVLQLWFALTKGQVPLSNFFPYGLSEGDSQLPRVFGGSYAIQIQFDFPFFNSTYRSVYLSTYGQINFGSGDSSSYPRTFPLMNYRSVASYWTYSNLNKEGDIDYRETIEPGILGRITDEIRSKFAEHQTFTSSWAFISTFDRVSASTCNYTYQTVLTSNGTQSFAIIYYASLSNTDGISACSPYAQVGFNAGDGKRCYLMENSNTPSIAQFALANSNVGVPGQWIFTIGYSKVDQSCNLDGLLNIYPTKLLYFGNQEVTITGPCFCEGQLTITVSFGGNEVQCNITNAKVIKCFAPLLPNLGYCYVSLWLNGLKYYYSYVVVVDINDQIVGDGQVVAKETTSLDSAFTLQWYASKACLIGGENILFKGFQTDYILNPFGQIISEESVSLQYANILNTGRCDFLPISVNRPSSAPFIRRVSLAGYCFSNVSIPIARTIFMASGTVSSAQCLNWYSQQPSESAMRDIVDEVSKRNPCPQGVAAGFPRTTGNFFWDETCNPSTPALCAFYHPNAKACYRSISDVNYSQRLAQCCYDTSFMLILGPLGGGTLLFANPTASLKNHLWQDVIPYVTCCKIVLLNICQKYFEKRPSIDSRSFKPPAIANANGDPHFTTWDGTTYTFNPIGEFDYIITPNETIQARIAQYKDNQGITKPACFFSAFVVQGNFSNKVQVELNSSKLFHILVDGKSMRLSYGLWLFRQISINYINDSTLVVQTASSLNLEIRIIGGVLHAIASLPATAKKHVRGLLGDFDGKTKNDLQLQDGSYIPIDSSPADIHIKFGMAWSTNINTSLFTYPAGSSWGDYQNRFFTPSFAMPSATSECNGDQDCNYDVQNTGNITLGLSNIAIKQRSAEVRNTNDETSKYCPRSVGVANGQVTVKSTQIKYTSQFKTSYSVECDSGYTLQGKQTVTCVNGTYDAIGACGSASKTPPITSTMIAIVLSASALRHLM